MRLSLITAALSTALVFGAALGASTNPANAESKFYNNWNALYPTSQTGANVVNGTGTSCQLCHVNKFGGKNYNGYGKKMYDLMKSGSSTDNAILGCETFDSDADPFGQTSLQEIMAGTQPGWTAGPNNTSYNNNGVTSTGNLPAQGVLGTMDLCDGGSAEVVRLGSPANPNALLPGTTGAPVVGQLWRPVVDHTSFLPGALIDLLVIDAGPQVNLPLSWGTLLVNYGPTSITQTRPAGAAFILPIPLDCAFVGIAATAQVGSISVTDILLTNALDIVVGTH